MKQQQFEIDATKSIIDWEGRKITGSHNGTIAIKQGALTVKDGQITGGTFVIDTTTIKVLDVTDPGTNAQFAGHLASDDFFSVEQYPEATFEITTVHNNRIEGNLTIKGITHAVSFESRVGVTGDVLTASGHLVIDRTKYGIKFRSGNFFTNLGDTLIYNDFDLHINLTARAAA